MTNALSVLYNCYSMHIDETLNQPSNSLIDLFFLWFCAESKWIKSKYIIEQWMKNWTNEHMNKWINE
jgi:hypothetical protein